MNYLPALFLVFFTPPVPAEEGLLSRWQFDREHVREFSVRRLAGPLDAAIRGPVRFAADKPHALLLDGQTKNVIEVTDQIGMAPLPKKSISVEAWVLIDKVQDWGGIVGVLQDNGSYEKGWLLGYGKSQFYFAVATHKAGKLTYLTSRQHFQAGFWYHVVGTYDGSTQRIYVDGKLQAQGKEQAGDIAYPPRAFYTIGAYRDDNEFYPMTGQLEQVSLFDRVLPAEEIVVRFEQRKSRFPGIEAAQSTVADWPTFLRDAQRTGMSPENLQFPLHLQWAHKARRAPDPSWPAPAQHDYWHNKYNLDARVVYDRAFHLVSVGDAVYFSSSSEDSVFCLDAHSGEERWSYRAEGPVRLAPTLVGQHVLFGSDDGHVYCLNAKDGSLVWKQLLGTSGRRIPGNGRVIGVWPVRTDVLVEEDKAYVCAGIFPSQGVYQCTLDVRTGRKLETTPLSVTAQGYLERLSGKLYVPTGRNPAGAFLSKLARRSKEISKEARSIPTDYPHAFIGAGDVRLGGGDGKLAAFQTTDGSKVWSAEVEGKVYSLAVARGQLLVSTDKGYIYCFSSKQVTPRVIELNKPVEISYPSAEMQDRYAQAAEWILKHSGITHGYCLVLGSGEGRLAHELAKRGSLQIVGREPDADRVARSRRALADAGLSGRVTIHQGGLDTLPYTDYLFNLIVSDSVVSEGTFTGSDKEALRVLRPSGGVAVLGLSERELVRRDPLKGAGEWSHMYGDAGNTACSGDQLIGNELQLQWFGRPGPRPMIDRHHRTVPPLYKNGRLFIPGEDRVIAVEAYNCTILWDRAIANTKRIAAFRDCSYMVAAPDRLYVAAGEKCLALDPQTGKQDHTFIIPALFPEEKRDWGYVGVAGHVLVGSGTNPGSSRRTQSREVVATQTYWDFVPVVGSNHLFALDRNKGTPLWTYRPCGLIVNSTIALGENAVFFLESGNPETLEKPVCQATLSELLGKGARLTALNLRSGEVLWISPLEEVSVLEHNVYLSHAQGKVVVVGSRNSGNDKKTASVLFDLYVFDAKTGEYQWGKTQDQRHKIGGDHGEQDTHPVIVGDKLYCEPYAYHLQSGDPIDWVWPWKQKKRSGCGTLSASASKVFFRDSTVSMFDLDSSKARQVTTTTRPGCWINLIPAGGLLLAPEASSGCTCNFAVQTSLALIPVK